MVHLALLSSKVPSEQRRALADKLLAITPTTEHGTSLNRFGVSTGNHSVNNPLRSGRAGLLVHFSRFAGEPRVFGT